MPFVYPELSPETHQRRDAAIIAQAEAMLLTSLPRPARWGLLVAGSAVFAALLTLAGLPAALMLGPMIAGIVMEIGGGAVRTPRWAFLGAQAVIGCMIAGMITPAIVGTFLTEWPLFLALISLTILASGVLGFLMSRMGVLPGTTAVWGVSPGAAITMILMAETFGADARLVAFMQFSRLVIVALTASIIARFWIDPSAMAATATIWFPPIHALPFAETIALAVIGAGLGRLSRVPSGVLLGPMFIGAILHADNLIAIELPHWLLAISYTVLGWNIGLSFTRPILARAGRAIPQTFLAIFVMIAFCGGLAFVLSRSMGIDPLTAYLATSPGGMDSIAIIAASSKADVAFIMGLQTVRFVMVLLVGPPMSRFIARRLGTPPTNHSDGLAADLPSK
jgi:membrane AbrB-like protein